MANLIKEYKMIIKLADGGDLLEALLSSIQNGYAEEVSVFINEAKDPIRCMEIVMAAMYEIQEEVNK